MDTRKFACGAGLALFVGVQMSSALADAPPLASASIPPVPVVSVVEAVRREVSQSVVVNGTLAPRDEILVSPEIDGYRITDVLVEEGASVTRGQLLIRLSRDLVTQQIAQQAALVDKAMAAIPQAQNNIEQAEAAEIEARLAFDRAKLLLQSGNTTAVIMEGRTAALRQSEGRLAIARNGLAIARADLAQALAVKAELALRLARTEIRAPEAGIVSRRSARVGMTATAAAEPLLRIIARGEIELEGEVLDARLPLLREGAPVSIDLGPGERARGRVRAVYPEVDRATRLGKVRIRLDPDPRLRIGSFVRSEVEVGRSNGVTLPLAAVHYGGDMKSSVLVVADGVVQMRAVRTGVSNGTDIEITDGVRAGEQVVARARSFLRNGDRVRPVLAPDQPDPNASASTATTPAKLARDAAPSGSN